MHHLRGRIQHYDWGTTDAIPHLLGLEPTGEPFAEYWLGAHPSAPAGLAEHLAEDDLAAHVTATPGTLGTGAREAFGDRLPFLLKVLSASRALSLQAHPSRSQAEEGFARENAAGIALDAAHRNYRDDWPKPEMVVALSEFEGLCGFRDPARTAELFEAVAPDVDGLGEVLAPLRHDDAAEATRSTFLGVLERADAGLVTRVVEAARAHRPGGDLEVDAFAALAVDVAEAYPGDPGVLAALLLRHVRLAPGEAMFLDAGNMHAYLRGTGIEIMASSDNVLRGGLTGKHVDLAELARVVDFAPSEALAVRTTDIGGGVTRFETPAPEFTLWRLDDVNGPLPEASAGRIVLVTEGTLQLQRGDDRLGLTRGEAAFLSASEHDVTAKGRGTAWLAGPGV